MDVWGAPLEIEVLLYGCLGSCCQLMALAQKSQNSRLLEQRLVLTREWKHDLRRYLLKHYWVTSKTMQVLRRKPLQARHLTRVPHEAVHRATLREAVNKQRWSSRDEMSRKPGRDGRSAQGIIASCEAAPLPSGRGQ